MNIEHYNRQRNVQTLPIQHNDTITGGRNEEHISKVLNIRSFMGKRHYIQQTKTKTTNATR